MRQTFLNGFLIGLLVILSANLVAVQLHSDCGLASFFGFSTCADGITRTGFPLIFYESGGFAYHQDFNLAYFLLDIFIGLDFATMCGFVAWYRAKRKNHE